LQEVRDECRSVFGSEIGKDLAKRGNIIVGCIIGQLHSRDDDARTWISRLHLINDLLKIVLDLINRDSSKGVIDPKLQNEDVDFAFQVGRETLQAAFRSAAGRAGIGYLKIQTRSAQLLCKQHRVGFTRRESETLRKTVTQDEDRFRRAGIDGFNR